MAAGIDPRPLLRWQIPDARQAYGRRDVAFYALSIGVGHDALDPGTIGLVDPWNANLQPLASMALVLGYPGFWLGDPAVERATGVAPSRVLHVDQSIDLHGPLPATGELIGRTRVSGLVDKGKGRDVLLYSERTLVDADGGRTVAVLRQTHLLRGCGGFGLRFGSGGGDVARWPDDFDPPPRRPSPAGTPPVTFRSTTRPEQALLYRLNGDANPLHNDPAVARSADLPRPILHGMATLGIACHAITAAVLDGRPGRLRSLATRMSAVVYPGETLETGIWPDGSFRTVAFERNVTVLDGGAFGSVP